MPIKRDSFIKQRTDKYMESMEAIVFFLYSNKDTAFTSSEISYETNVTDKELVLRILTDLKKEGRITERLIFDGKSSNFYYIMNVEDIEDQEEEENGGEGAS